ncbi:copper resistance system multicopper oxidase [Aquabacterium sp. J223]|uniref:copper resistance system multicopper oxidase n=1 Tax=Aquabacterium sp. J223 TaxID=2898431 RepID=UPI0021AD7D2E|nr:copper resistance system multicopper oxidase [Aquabacterium sp. J223]UUX96676.1 copper resistance system multicopper oxidase [Aquabacterium sp. J223]
MTIDHQRRRFSIGVGLATCGVAAGGFAAQRAAAQAPDGRPASGAPPMLSGTEFDLSIGTTAVNFTGAQRTAITVNGSLPAPVLRWKQGTTVTMRVTNTLAEATSIHWHGLLLPFRMDGVPGISFDGIRPGETFVYRFPVVQSGTYWYHSHSAFQEQLGLYGPIVIDPEGANPVTSDREHVMFLSDWTDETPERLFAKLKIQSDYYNFQVPTVGDFMRDMSQMGWKAAWARRKEWNQMRMSPTDTVDVSSAAYTYLVNGHPPTSNWTAIARPGERVRLRFVNGSASSIFDVRIPGLPMTVVATDGQDVQPVTVDEFRISTAETYDVIVQLPEERAYTVFVQSIDRMGYARATLAPHAGLQAEVPPLDPRTWLTMADMGMGGMKMDAGMPGMSDMQGGGKQGMQGMQGMGGGSVRSADKAASTAAAPDSGAGAGHDMSSMPGMRGMPAPGGHRMDGMQEKNLAPAAAASAASASKQAAARAGHDMSSMPGMQGGSMQGMQGMQGSDMGAMKMEQPSVAIDNRAMNPGPSVNDPGPRLRDNGRRVLVYADLHTVGGPIDPRPPGREIVLRLTGNMRRFIWGFDGKKYSEAEPIRLRFGERVRITLINDTMMSHPIHLHGMWSEVEDADGQFLVRKHTVNVNPGSRLSYRVSVDAPGQWAFHCHLLYHMESGMFRKVVVE